MVDRTGQAQCRLRRPGRAARPAAAEPLRTRQRLPRTGIARTRADPVCRSLADRPAASPRRRGSAASRADSIRPARLPSSRPPESSRAASVVWPRSSIDSIWMTCTARCTGAPWPAASVVRPGQRGIGRTPVLQPGGGQRGGTGGRQGLRRAGPPPPRRHAAAGQPPSQRLAAAVHQRAGAACIAACSQRAPRPGAAPDPAGFTPRRGGPRPCARRSAVRAQIGKLAAVVEPQGTLQPVEHAGHALGRETAASSTPKPMRSASRSMSRAKLSWPAQRPPVRRRSSRWSHPGCARRPGCRRSSSPRRSATGAGWSRKSARCGAASHAKAPMRQHFGQLVAGGGSRPGPDARRHGAGQRKALTPRSRTREGRPGELLARSSGRSPRARRRPAAAATASRHIVPQQPIVEQVLAAQSLHDAPPAGARRRGPVRRRRRHPARAVGAAAGWLPAPARPAPAASGIVRPSSAASSSGVVFIIFLSELRIMPPPWRWRISC